MLPLTIALRMPLDETSELPTVTASTPVASRSVSVGTGSAGRESSASPGRGVEDYIASATIEAVKPAL